MLEITLYIESPSDSQTLALENEISFGRTNLAQVVIADPSLSRLHATIFREGDILFIQDENSTNGTFVNGGRIAGERRLNDRDEIQLGNSTRIFVEIRDVVREAQPREGGSAEKQFSALPGNIMGAKGSAPVSYPESQIPIPKSKLPIVPLIAGLSTVLIIAFALIAILIARSIGGGTQTKNSAPTPMVVRSGLLIPVRVIDPLGGEDPEDLDDLIASWETEEKELNAADIGEITSASSSAAELAVPVALWEKERNLAFAPRESPVGNDPPGTIVPREVFGDGVIKQKAKLAELLRSGYQQPMDFADLAQKRLNRELIELPMATDFYFLDVGGSAGEDEFTAFDFDAGTTAIAPGSGKFQALSRLAQDFEGQKYDLANGRDRRQMRIRLLRMFHPRAKPILEELAKAYQQKFNRPLRVTSLTRSMDYQIGLNKTNPNSFKVSGKGSLPPHTSGCAFDLARKHMTAEEQNFVMQKLAEMERRGALDALREGNVNACFHIFIYPDGRPPRM